MKHLNLIAATALGTVLALPASAATLDFTNLSAAWTNPVGGTIQENNSPQTGTNTASISWGANPVNISGYDFAFNDDPVPNPAAEADTPFEFGTFTHRNQVIELGTAIDEVTLELTGDIRLDGNTVVSGATFDFLFGHNETPNFAMPCEFGDEIPCGDGVTVSVLTDSDVFQVGNVEYTLSLNGFIPEDGDEPSTFFFSDEGANNSASLEGEFSAVVIPLPAAGWMLIAGVGGLAALRRRKKA